MNKGWQTKTLGEICDIERGGSPRPIQNFITNDPNGINWIKIGDATASGKYIYKTEEKIRPEGVKRSRMVYEGDFILSNSMSFGRPYIMKTTGCIHDGWLVLHQPKVDPDYLYYVLSSDIVFSQFDRLAAGSTVRNLNIGSAKSVEIPYPPLPEQQRIVGLLDEAFGGLATAQAHAAQNLQNARDLFESHLNAVFTQRGKGWVEKTVDQVCIRLHQGLNTAGEKVKFYETGYPIIQTRNIENGVIERDTKIKFMCEEDWQRYRDKYRPEVGDVFFTNIGTIGKTAIVTDCMDYLIHWNIFKLRPRLETITSEFLKFTLDHLTQSGFFHRLQKGGTVEFVTKKMIAEASIGVPDTAQQQHIVAQLDNLASENQKLTRIYEQKLAALAELKKSLLHQAFSGEL
jgi:type I restriction enzyme S subunit